MGFSLPFALTLMIPIVGMFVYPLSQVFSWLFLSERD